MLSLSDPDNLAMKAPAPFSARKRRGDRMMRLIPKSRPEIWG